MAFSRLDISGFRNLTPVKLEPISPGFNFIYGQNGSGKTSLLEAIYYLGLGRSFRTATLNRLVGYKESKLSLFAQITTSSNQIIPIGIERHASGEVKIRLSGQDVRSIAELASLIPVQIINSSSFNLLEAPSFRRKYLDWGVFYFSTDFIRIWRQWERILKQRNAALRSNASQQELTTWTHELVISAIELEKYRCDYIKNLFPYLVEMVNEIVHIEGINISYYPGWDEEVPYLEVLDRSLQRDLQLGYTQLGPHRADLKFTINKAPAKDILSRGQQKLFVCAMLLAQGVLLQGVNKKPIYLVDDLPSELDITSRSKLMALLSKQEGQVFVTAVEREALDRLLIDCPTKMFHVEHGNIVI